MFPEHHRFSDDISGKRSELFCLNLRNIRRKFGNNPLKYCSQTGRLSIQTLQVAWPDLATNLVTRLPVTFRSKLESKHSD